MKPALLMIAASLCVTSLRAQQFYGRINYTSTFPVTSAEVTDIGIPQGYLNAFTNFNNNSRSLFSIRQTNSLTTTGTAGTFYNVCEVGDSINAKPARKFNFSHGTKVVEATTAGTHNFFLASCVSRTATPPAFQGFNLVWTALDAAGQPIPSTTFFNAKSIFFMGGINPGPPCVTPGYAPGEYFICGGYTRMGAGGSSLYVIKTNTLGVVLWRKQFDLNSLTLAPTAILQANGAEVVLTGNIETAPQSYPFTNKPAYGAFFMKISSSTGSMISNSVYEDYRFESLAPSPNNFLIGGCKIHSTAPYYQPLMLEIDPTNNILWSTVFFSNPIGTSITSVFRRRSINSNLEYFGCFANTDTRDVVRLDANGVLYSGGFNWFVYPTQTNSVHSQCYMTFKTNGTLGDGFQLHGSTNYSVPAPSIYNQLVMAYFNGQHSGGNAVNCIEGLFNANQTFVSMTASQLSLFEQNGPTTTKNCGIKPITASVLRYAECFHNNVPGGNNLRASVQTAIGDDELNQAEFGVFPNPANNYTFVKYNALAGEPVTISILDITGKQLKTLSFKADEDGTQETELNLSSLNLEPGVYFVRTTVGDAHYEAKLFYTKNN